MESFPVDVKYCLQSNDSQAKDEDYLYLKGKDNLACKKEAFYGTRSFLLPKT